MTTLSLGGGRLGPVKVKTDVTHVASAYIGVFPVGPWMSVEVDGELRKQA